MKASEKWQALEYASDVIESCLVFKHRQAVKFVSSDLVIRCTKRHKGRSSESRSEFVVTIGKPNYRECLVVKKVKDNGVVFPVKELLVREWPLNTKPKKTKRKK